MAAIDTIPRGRLVSGFIRGTGRETITHNSPSPYNWVRFQEAHDFIIKAWTTGGPFRWDSQHINYRYLNPWPRPNTHPHPPIWIPSVVSKNTAAWASRHRYPCILLSTDLEPTPNRRSSTTPNVHAKWATTPILSTLATSINAHVVEAPELAEAPAKKFS